VLTPRGGRPLPDAEHITVTAIPGGYQVEAVGVSAHGSTRSRAKRHRAAGVLP